MKKINMIMIWVVLFLARNSYADIDSLFKGVAVNDATLNELSTTTTPDAFAYGISWLAQESVGGGTVDAFLKVPNSTDLYSLSSKLKLYHTNFDTRALLGNWPLTRTPDDQSAPISQFFESNTREGADEYDFQVGNYNDPALGCLWDTPLRYGDIEQDATNELVLLLGYDRTDKINRQLDIVIFSPQQQKVIFSSRLVREDIGPLTTEAFPNYTRQDKPGQLPKTSSSDTSTGLGNSAIRAYSKLYLGDFDENGKQDILIWRKRYDSKPIDDAVQGYILRKELLTHYELIEGEYLAQPTEEITIKEWLTTKQLSWQKGYPNQSECAGQENQLIPEMHDPLLNDADVLK